MKTLTRTGAATPRARLMAAAHALGSENGTNLEQQPNEYVVKSIVTDASGKITLTARLQSCAAGSTSASCAKANPAGVVGGPIDWSKASLPASFRARASAAGGFDFTGFFRTNDCGATFDALAELEIPGFDDRASNDTLGASSPCDDLADGAVCGELIGKEKGVLYRCAMDDASRRVLYRACACKAGACEVGAHESGCECEEPAASLCNGVDDGTGLCGQSVGKDPKTLFTCQTDDAGKHVLATVCTCTDTCSVGAHQGGCTCASP